MPALTFCDPDLQSKFCSSYRYEERRGPSIKENIKIVLSLAGEG